jgi:CBS-domain-containing membrane protein
VLTDRDICMAAYTTGRRLRDLRVADCMSKGIATCRPDDDLAAAARTMAEHRVRRLPVVDAQRKVIGVLSMNDVVRAAESRELAEQTLSALKSICAPRAVVGASQRRAPSVTAAGPTAASQHVAGG